MRAAFTLVELLVAVAVIAVLCSLFITVTPQLMARADSADALAKIRKMGAAVLHYPADHNGYLPQLFPGQVLEYEEGRGGRVVTECAAYLGIEQKPQKYLVASLMPRAYTRLPEPKDKNAVRVYVMNSAIANNDAVVSPFGRVTVPGQPPTGNAALASLADASSLWMMSTTDQQQPNVAFAPWKNNTPKAPPLGDKRAVFHFDGTANLAIIGKP